MSKKKKSMGREFQIAYTLPKIMHDYMQTIASAENMTVQKLSRRVVMIFINDYIKEMQNGRE